MEQRSSIEIKLSESLVYTLIRIHNLLFGLLLFINGFGIGLEVVFGIYSKLLLILLCIADYTHLQFINRYMGFLRTFTGRGIVQILWGFIWVPNNGYSFESALYGHVYGWVLVGFGVVTLVFAAQNTVSYPPPLNLILSIRKTPVPGTEVEQESLNGLGQV
jgi:hypothetical protein